MSIQDPAPIAGKRRCRKCGCTDERACVTPAGPCHWVEPDLCSACAGTRERNGFRGPAGHNPESVSFLVL